MKNKTTLATVLFVVGILLAGCAHALAKLCTIWFMDTPDTPVVLPFFSTLMFCLNLGIYITLLVFWIQSLFQRLLPSRERSYLICAAVCMAVMLVLRSVKYRLVDEQNDLLLRYLWYLYYIPMLLMPTLFLMTCLRIEGKNREKRFDNRWLLLPAAVLAVLFLTNDLHHLAFAPVPEYPMNGAYKTYTNQILLYVYYGYYVVTIGLGLFLLTKANSRFHSFQKAAKPFLFLLVMLGLTLIDKALTLACIPSMFLVPEIVSFGMIGVFESCIRNRLIPYNENYAGFFGKMRFPAMITDRGFSPAYRSAQGVSASAEQLTGALSEPVYTDEDTKLSAREVTAGYAFYTEDESELHRLNEKLRDANELIEGENDLIQAENELKAKQAQVDSRNLIYARIAEKMLPYHRLALHMIDGMKSDDPDFDRQLARLNLLNAYIKRGTNLLLAEEGNDYISVNELNRALDELSLYLNYLGIQTNIKTVGETISRTAALALFTAVYELVSALNDQTAMLHIVIDGASLRVTSDGAPSCALPEPITMKESGGLFFYSYTVREGGAL